MVIHGDGVTDDSGALQAYLDGKVDLIYSDGTPFLWPGKSEAKHAISKPLLLPNSAAHTEQPKPKPLLPGAWVGRK